MRHIRIPSSVSLSMDEFVLVVHINYIQLLFKLLLLGILCTSAVLVVAGLEDVEVGLVRTYPVKMVYGTPIPSIVLVFVYLIWVAVSGQLTFTVHFLAVIESVVRLVYLQVLLGVVVWKLMMIVRLCHAPYIFRDWTQRRWAHRFHAVLHSQLVPVDGVHLRSDLLFDGNVRVDDWVVLPLRGNWMYFLRIQRVITMLLIMTFSQRALDLLAQHLRWRT